MGIKCMTPVEEHHLALIRGNGETEYFVWDLCLSGLCTGIPVINPGFNPRQKSVFLIPFFSFSLYTM